MKIRSKQSGVALVVTLLMLSVITFLTVAFLAMSRRDRASVAVSVSQKESRAMSDVGLARAQSEVISRMMGTLDQTGRPDILSYDLMVSRNYINRNGFFSGSASLANVNYAYANGNPLNQADLNQNIANLYFDPRPPVFVKTNSNPLEPLDFRYYVDINRNGLHEPSGFLPASEGGKVLPTNWFSGEPEWIGVLRYPELRHSSSNHFVGRYAFLVQPIGKTLDLNYIHNYSRALVPTTLAPSAMDGYDGLMRSQGFGSWELNLAAALREINPYSYVSNTPNLYNYRNGNGLNTGDCFGDAKNILRYRYNRSYDVNNLPSVFWTLGSFNGRAFTNDLIDGYSAAMGTGGSFDFTRDPDNVQFGSRHTWDMPWPGSDNPIKFYDYLNEIYNTNAFIRFATNMLAAAKSPDSNRRYTLQRFLSSIGTESEPELMVDLPSTNGTWERVAKINLNYDNRHEITNGLNHATTNYVEWTNALAFFTNAASFILKQQFANDPDRRITNLCVYSSTNRNLVYDPVVHRCLQLAANIYDAVNPGTNRGSGPSDRFMFPTVFRPLFSQRISGSVTNVYIVGFEEVGGLNQTNNFSRYWNTNSMKELVGSTIYATNNVWGIPWIIGAKKGLPNFNELCLSNQLGVSRKITFTKSGHLNHPDGTNQIMFFSLTNLVGVELWNSYRTNFARPVTIVLANQLRIGLTNEQSVGTTIAGTNVTYFDYLTTTFSNWPGFDGIAGHTASFKVPFSTNRAVLPGFCQYFERFGTFEGTNSYTESMAEFTNGFPVHNWVLNITNNLACAILDQKTGRVLDFVNLGNYGISRNISEWLNSIGDTSSNPFRTNGATSSPSSPPSEGVLNQIRTALTGLSVQYFRDTPEQQDQINGLNSWWNDPSQTTNKAAWYQPSVTMEYGVSYQANDPLVHYHYLDLMDPSGFRKQSLGDLNIRYQPWTNDPGRGIDDTRMNMTFKDPNVARSDDWNFPTNKFPNVGYLGRVHRGTPWQTIFLKADKTDQADYLKNRQNWVNNWTGYIQTYPTNDWALVDLFTVAPNDNASRGTLSVNQTNLAAWSAVFSGVTVQTNKYTNGVGALVDPTNVPAFSDGASTNFGINAVRNTKPNRLFHRIGEILEAPSLTIGSPFVGNPVNDPNISDQVVESLPQRTLSLLRVGQPRFVVWAWGQALRPTGVVLGGQYNQMPTNYAITGESLTRTVCRVERTTNNVPRIVIESFNVIPGE